MSIPNKLYRVTLMGMTYSATGTIYGVSYAVAKDPHDAYVMVRSYLERKNLGFRSDRCLKQVELIAEETDYPECKTILFLTRTKEGG